MTTLRRILYPTDFSTGAERAFDEALALARCHRAELLLLHCDCIVPEACELALERHRERAGAAGVSCRVITRTGKPAATAIVEAARDLVADIVVLGTHGRTGLDRVLLGSVTEAVLHSAPCPVLSVSGTVAASPTAVFRRVLCAVDFSPASRDTVAHALALSSEAAARVTLLHVVETLAGAPARGPVRSALESYDYAVQSASDALDDMLPRDVRERCEARTKVTTGRAWRSIVAEASADGSDLIVIGAHGHEGPGTVLFGSTAQMVVRHAPCAVLTVRHDDGVRRHAEFAIPGAAGIHDRMRTVVL